MTRYFGVVLCVLLVGVIAIVLMGRAIDEETQDRVIFTRDGVTLDCERITDISGRTFYDSCVRVP